MNVNFYPEILLQESRNKKIKWMRGAMKYLGVWSPGLGNVFWKIFKTLQPCPPTHLMYAPLMITLYIFYKMCAQMLKKLYVKETFHLLGKYSLIIYSCCCDFEGALAKVHHLLWTPSRKENGQTPRSHKDSLPITNHENKGEGVCFFLLFLHIFVYYICYHLYLLCVSVFVSVY